MVEGNAPVATQHWASPAACGPGPAGSSEARITPARLALLNVTNDLDGAQEACESLRQVAAEFQDLRRSIEGISLGTLIDARVDGVRVPLPAATIVRAKHAELKELSDHIETTARSLRLSVGNLLDWAALPMTAGLGTEVEEHRAHASRLPDAEAPGDGDLIDAIAEALSVTAGAQPPGNLGVTQPVLSGARPDAGAPVADMALRFAAATP